jgi:hypothetical protein
MHAVCTHRVLARAPEVSAKRFTVLDLDLAIAILWITQKCQRRSHAVELPNSM